MNARFPADQQRSASIAILLLCLAVCRSGGSLIPVLLIEHMQKLKRRSEEDSALQRTAAHAMQTATHTYGYKLVALRFVSCARESLQEPRVWFAACTCLMKRRQKGVKKAAVTLGRDEPVKRQAGGQNIETCTATAGSLHPLLRACHASF